MSSSPGLFNKDRNIQILLFLCSGLFWFVGLKDLFLHANSLLTTLDGDAIKNYYTYIHHTVAGSSVLEFKGFNYPYGEHIVYADAQPLLTWIFGILPFTHNYLVGILHFLILFSFIITPCVYFKIFRLFQLNGFVAFFSSLAIVILSPQLARINGHFGLSYACFIPLLILLLVKYSMQPTRKLLIGIFIFNTLVFFIHPYFGLGLSLLSFAYLLLYGLISKTNCKTVLTSVISTGLLPILLFKAFMFLTDHHTGRSDYVYGADVYISNTASVFVSHFGGPFEHMMKQVVKVGNREWEGLSYIGFFLNILMLVVAVISIVYYRRYRFNKIALSLLLCSVLLLLFSFGLPVMIAKGLGIESGFLNQFRSAGRYAWFFYYILPVFLIVSLDKFFKDLYSPQVLKWMIPVSLLFLALNLVEGKYYFKKTFENSFTARNIFRAELLSEAEKKLVSEVKAMDPQALLPIPFYHIGSEVLERDGSESCYISILLAWHCDIPIIGAQLARTSVTETRAQMELLDPYTNHDRILSLFNDKPVAMIQKGPAKLPDENGLAKRATLCMQIDEYKLYRFSKKEFDFDPALINNSYVNIMTGRNRIDTLGCTWIKTENRPPFLPVNQKEYAKVFSIEKGQYPAGKYIVSFQYHFKAFEFKYFDCGFIISEDDGKELPRTSRTMIRRGHLYDTLIVFEQELVVNNGCRYDLILTGGSGENYHISDFLLRPDTMNVIQRNAGELKQVLINGHPYSFK
jgi:hypothetical protein